MTNIIANVVTVDNSKPSYKVFTGQDSDGRVKLHLHVSGQMTNPKERATNAYYPNQQTQIIDGKDGETKVVTIFQEHGWFTSEAIFRQICLNQPVPLRQTEQESFEEWRSAVLSAASNDKAHWTSHWM
ncbi:hypothetical protein K505DRAFT_366398 [Melanomma pulvis-pyrius CBS 109.77]|uniref:Uncharacterized protein n=1 Tax=Melanomma pulvis-pyrius CBS 109.77 TaxID=1314802 RepID=A0A6A6WX69_9PLEO|nr:hypothetical protein K505DRAFT_366398 [Melanomma pulvis-pyrius CBS 109.77]